MSSGSTGADLPKPTQGDQQTGTNEGHHNQDHPQQVSHAKGETPPGAIPPGVEEAHKSGNARAAIEALAQDPQAKTEEITTPPAPDLDSGYKERLAGIGDRLDKILTQAPEVIQFGPIYSVPMPGGSTQQVITLFYDIPGETNDATGNSDSYRRFDIIALDPNGYPIADRYTTVHFMNLQGRKYAMAQGMIATGIRGARLTAPVELAHMDIMQREANRLEGQGYDNGLQFHISNANLERLQSLEEQYAETQDASLLPQIEVKRAEQQRWQSIYGPQGWLGFNTSWERVFTPNPEGERLETSRDVAITRVDGKPTVQGVTSLPVSEQATYRAKQLDKLRTVVQRIKTVAPEPKT